MLTNMHVLLSTMYLFFGEGDKLCLYGKVFELVIPGLETVTLSEEEVPAGFEVVCVIRCAELITLSQNSRI